jgi:hypothetical protein
MLNIDMLPSQSIRQKAIRANGTTVDIDSRQLTSVISEIQIVIIVFSNIDNLHTASQNISRYLKNLIGGDGERNGC